MVPDTGLYRSCLDIRGQGDLFRADLECNFFSPGKGCRGFKKCFPDCNCRKTSVVFPDNPVKNGIDANETRDVSSHWFVKDVVKVTDLDDPPAHDNAYPVSEALSLDHVVRRE